MAPISPGKAGPLRKPRKQTQTTKSHRYEPFTKRVAKLKIDPVHKVQKSRLKESSNDVSQSYFRSALDELSELNLTTTFTSFYQRVNGLSESLPQVLFHVDEIVKALLEHIEKEDTLALEALLNLVAHLAHDLGQEFQTYFAQTVTLVARLSTTQNDPAVVEACFTCLAWMYKYLGRLLVQDLRPLLDIVMPYFAMKKEYVRRFTAESLAFLLRKAAVLSTKNEKPLKQALDHILQHPTFDLKSEDKARFAETAMLLLAETAIGVDAALHSSAAALFSHLFNVLENANYNQPGILQLAEGILINLIHRTDAIGFRPLLQLILNDGLTDSPLQQQLAMRLLLIVAATRGGTRVEDWRPIVALVVRRFASRPSNTNLDCAEELQTLTKTTLAILTYGSLDQILPDLDNLSQAMMDNGSSSQFFSFCEALGKLNKRRFQDLILPRLQKYIVEKWSEDENGTILLLHSLRELDCVESRPGKPDYVTIGEDWERAIQHRWSTASSPSLQQDLLLSRAIHFPRSAEVQNEFAKHLHQQLEVFASTSHDLSTQNRIAIGWGLQALMQLMKAEKQSILDVWSLLATLPDEAYKLLPFIEVLGDVVPQSQVPDGAERLSARTLAILQQNLTSPAKELRTASLQLLSGCTAGQQNLKQVYDLCLEILETEYTIANARSISMLLRRLPQAHKAASSNQDFQLLIPFFTLGLLPDYHDALRREVAKALGQMMISTLVEEAVMDRLGFWVARTESRTLKSTTQSVASDDEAERRVTVFECTRLQSIEYAFRSGTTFDNAGVKIAGIVAASHRLNYLDTPTQAHEIALQTLIEIPQLAEKRSKMITPAFLVAQKRRAGYQAVTAEDGSSTNTLSPKIEETGWTLRERKLFLQLLASFNNPRVLYRAEEVKHALLVLLGSGDPSMRKIALEAVLGWKEKALVKHKEALLRVAEDKQTNSDLALMLSADDEARTFKGQDRADVLPILLRLVFGQLIGRVGVHGSQEAKRKSILRMVFRLSKDEVDDFLDIVLGPLSKIHISCKDGHAYEHEEELPPLDQQYGFLRMVLSMLEVLQTQFGPFVHKVIEVVLLFAADAARTIDSSTYSRDVPVLLRNVRRAGLQCLNEILLYCPEFEISQYTGFVYNRLIQPRLTGFVVENNQGVSGLLTLFSMLVLSKPRIACLQQDENASLAQCWALLCSTNAKPVVKLFILESVLTPLMKVAENDASIAALIRDQSQAVLEAIAGVLADNPTKDLLTTAADSTQSMITFSKDNASHVQVLDLFTTMLAEPNQRLPPHIKGRILSAIAGITAISDAGKYYHHKFYELLCSFLDFFRDTPNRAMCVTILKHIARDLPDLGESVDACESLGLQSQSQLGEIDYNRQSDAFARIHNILPRLDVRSFLPTLHSLIFLTRSNADPASRGNALSSLKHLSTVLTGEVKDAQIVQQILLQAIRKHIKDDSETVRADFVELLGVAVNCWANHKKLQDLRPLLVGNDEEASFFTNVLHIQNHRRTRAIRRLVSEVETGAIDASSITEYFLPLLRKFADDSGADDSVQATKGQAVASMTILLQWLEWKQFRTVFRQYRQTLYGKADDDKIDVRLLSHAADALANAIACRKASDLAVMPHLARSLPEEQVISNELTRHFIPKLAELSHYKDEGELDQRLPAAVVAIKLIKLLPEDQTALLAAPIVLDIAQVLRSRTQETRDMARNKLAEAVKILGASSLSFVLKELRTALTRGYQLHVLSYTLHTMLLVTAEEREVGDLDYCVDDIVKVILDDVFGVVGQEKENQDYISSMKEVKANKSFDSMEIIAKSTTVQHLSKIVLPFETLLSGSLTSRQVRHVDELFRRIGVGISHSPTASSQDLLILAYQLIQSFYKAKPATPVRPLTNDERNRDRYLVQKEQSRQAATSLSIPLMYKIAKFAIDIARSTFARHNNLLTPENVHSFVPIIGDALVEAQDDVRVSAMRLLATVIKLKMSELDANAGLYVMEAVKVVKASTSTNEEAAQAALKVVAAILRERHSVEVRDSDIAYLLKRTTPDLEEPDRQGVTFNFVKAVMARQLQLPEVYDLVDKLGTMMVTSQSRNSRDTAMGVYIHFLLDYPQGKGRWSKQVKFLVKNLEYQYPEGRQSVMEGISTLLAKVDRGTTKELAAVLFIPIVLRMSNDESERCREMAAALLQQIFNKSSGDDIVSMLQPIRAWSRQDDNNLLQKIALQAWSIFFKSRSDQVAAEVPSVTEELLPILRRSTEDHENAWEMQYHALELAHVIVAEYPDQLLGQEMKDFWVCVVTKLSTTHTWLQFSASSLVGMLFKNLVADGKFSLPLSTSHGLQVDEALTVNMLRASLRLLKHQTTSLDLANIVTQNLLYLTQVAQSSEMTIALKVAQEDEHDEDEEELEEASKVHDHVNGASDMKSIPALQYILDQASRVLRREPPKHTSSTCQPRLSYATFLSHLISAVPVTKLLASTASLTQLIVPLLHLTSPNTPTPRSSDSTFAETHASLVEQANILLEALQKALGDKSYMSCVTAASRIAREKRQERRQKRAIEVVADPERAAQDKKRRHEKEKRRKKEAVDIHRGRRRKDLGF